MPQMNIKNFLEYVPAPANASPKIRLLFSAILVIVFIFLCIPFASNDKYNKYIEKMIKFSPVKEAQSLYEKNGPRAASEYVSFYQSLPNYKKNESLNKIKEKAEEHRGQWVYIAEEFGRGLIGMKPHEYYAETVSHISGYVPYLSDVKDIVAHGRGLWNNWNKFKNNENVDALQLGIDGIGLTASLCGLIPAAGHAADPVKKSAGILRKCVEIMTNELKTYILQLFKNVFNYIMKSGLLETDIKSYNQLSGMLAAKKNQFEEAMTLAEGAMKQLYPLLNLAAHNWGAASLVLQNAKSPEELKNYIDLVTQMDKTNPKILEYGGSNALKAAARLEKEGALNMREIENAMAYGQAGLEAVGHIPARYFSASSLKIEKGGLSGARKIILFIFGLYSLLALIKIWRPQKSS